VHAKALHVAVVEGHTHVIKQEGELQHKAGQGGLQCNSHY
jgi:hypothetical protein